MEVRATPRLNRIELNFSKNYDNSLSKRVILVVDESAKLCYPYLQQNIASI